MVTSRIALMKEKKIVLDSKWGLVIDHRRYHHYQTDLTFYPKETQICKSDWFFFRRWKLFFNVSTFHCKTEKQSSRPGNPCWRGMLRTVDLLVPTSKDQLLFILKILFTFFTKQAMLMRRSTVLSLPVEIVFPVASRVAIFCRSFTLGASKLDRL